MKSEYKGTKFLNLACGENFIINEKWLNFDFIKREGVNQINLLEKLPLDDQCVDVVYCSHFIEHIPEHMVSSFLTECFRVLKNNGKLIFCQTNPDHKYFQPSRNTISYYTYSEILTKLKKYGFKATVLAKIEDTKNYKNNISNLKNFFSSNSLLKNILIFLRKQLLYKKIPDILPIDSYQSELGKLKEINKDTNLTDIRVMYFVCSKL